MKKFLLLLICFLLIGCSNTKNQYPSSDNIKFSIEYEELNGRQTEDAENHYLDVQIPINAPIKYIEIDKLLSIMDENSKESAIIYFGFANCPWCRNMVEAFMDSAIENDVKEVLYFNNNEFRNTLKLSDTDEILVTKEAAEGYESLLIRLGEHASVYKGLKDDSIKRLYFPSIIFIKDGEIIKLYEGTHPDVSNPYEELTKKQYKELKETFTEYIRKVQS